MGWEGHREAHGKSNRINRAEQSRPQWDRWRTGLQGPWVSLCVTDKRPLTLGSHFLSLEACVLTGIGGMGTEAFS